MKLGDVSDSLSMLSTLSFKHFTMMLVDRRTTVRKYRLSRSMVLDVGADYLHPPHVSHSLSIVFFLVGVHFSTTFLIETLSPWDVPVEHVLYWFHRQRSLTYQVLASCRLCTSSVALAVRVRGERSTVSSPDSLQIQNLQNEVDIISKMERYIACITERKKSLTFSEYISSTRWGHISVCWYD